MTQKKFEYAIESHASEAQLSFRARLNQMLEETPIPTEHLATNFGLYMRSSALVKFLVLNELYQLIIDVPGVIMEFGTWWGQNLVVFENLRAIYEPFNKMRRIIGFDTFAGYSGFSDKDRAGNVVREGGYAVAPDYRAYLEELLEVHVGNNVLGHVRGRHALVQGNVIDTVPQYFGEHPETIVSLAYLDVGLYEPTKAILQGIRPHLIPGSVVVMDELTWPETPGEAVAFKEVFADMHYTIRKSRLTPERAIVIIGQR
jgi:hypothetical protein